MSAVEESNWLVDSGDLRAALRMLAEGAEVQSADAPVIRGRDRIAEAALHLLTWLLRGLSHYTIHTWIRSPAGRTAVCEQIVSYVMRPSGNRISRYCCRSPKSTTSRGRSRRSGSHATSAWRWQAVMRTR